MICCRIDSSENHSAIQRESLIQVPPNPKYSTRIKTLKKPIVKFITQTSIKTMFHENYCIHEIAYIYNRSIFLQQYQFSNI